MTHHCPTCGQTFDVPGLRVDLNTNTAFADGREAHVSARIAEILHIILDAHPSTTSMERLVSELTGWHPEPMAEATIRVMLGKANIALEPLGYRIVNVFARGWRIAAIAPVAVPA